MAAGTPAAATPRHPARLGSMPPKSAKNVAAAKEKIAVDKTFGMKNKNKSKVVQKYIKAVIQNSTGAPKGGREEQQRKEKDEKEKTVAKAALMNSLFNMATDKKGRAFDAAAKKKAKQQEEESLAAGKKLTDEVRKAIIEGIANSICLTNTKGVRMSDLGGHPIIHALKDKYADTFKILSMLLFIKANPDTFWIDDPECSNPTIRCQADVDAETAPDERSIEEIIEEKRAALPPGGTPVTLVSFTAWKERREAQRLAAVEEENKAIIKKAGSKGIVGMSGRDLFIFDASLFVDDAAAADANEYDERSDQDEEEDEAYAGALNTTGALNDLVEEEDEEGAEGEAPGASSSGALGSGEATAADAIKEAINENLFLEGGDDDLPSDDDDEEDDGETKMPEGWS